MTNTEMTRQTGSTDDGRNAITNATAIRPFVDIFETAGGITLRADMPGVSKENLDLRVEGPNLLVEGTIDIVPEQQMTALYADVRSTLYRRSFVLGNELEASRIDADLRDGVLTIRIPKRAELRPRRIEVRT